MAAKRKLRILHAVEAYPPSVGGMPEVVKRISEGLVEAQYEVTVATSYHPARNSLRLNGVQIEQFKIAGNKVSGISGANEEIARFQELLLSGNFDVITVFAAQQWSADIAVDCLEQIQAKKVFVPTGFSALGLPQFAEYYQQMRKWLLLFDMNVFLSNTYQDIQFARASKVQRMCIIPNGAAKAEFLPLRNWDMRTNLGIDPNARMLLLVGSHTGLKGHSEAIEILERLETKNVCLVIAGNMPEWIKGHAHEPLLQRMKFLVKRLVKAVLRIPENRYHCPKDCLSLPETYNARSKSKTSSKKLIIRDFTREDVVALYQQSDLFLFPSNIECSPIVLFEAAAGRTAFAATNVGNSTEIAEWTGGGIILPTRKDRGGYSHVNIDDSVKLIDELLSDNQRLSELAQNGHRAWLRHYTWESIVQQYASLYDKLIHPETDFST